MNAILGRCILTVIVLMAWGAINSLISIPQTLITGSIAGHQFDNDNASYVISALIFNAFHGIGAVVTLVACLILVAIWWAPFKRLVYELTVPAALLAYFTATPPAYAFFEKTERTEAYTILPNESAFFIPDVGQNKEEQAKFDSEQYLNANKVSLKRFVVPHAKLSNSGGYLGWDYYVPTGRLIIVDRTPYSREWVDAHDRGTSASKQGFPCQTIEGIDYTVGISIGVSVLEQNAAKYLYNFGVVPPKGDRTDGNVIFTSVYYSRSVAEVMDDVGRKMVQTLVCNEIAAQRFDDANAKLIDMMDNIKKHATEYLASVGITLNFIGWADTVKFADEVQKAINEKYIAATLQPYMPVLQALAQLKVQEGLGKGLGDKGPPVVVTPDMINALVGMAAPPAQ